MLAGNFCLLRIASYLSRFPDQVHTYAIKNKLQFEDNFINSVFCIGLEVVLLDRSNLLKQYIIFDVIRDMGCALVGGLHSKDQQLAHTG